MNKKIKILVLLIVMTCVCLAQNNDLYENSKPASTNIPGAEFPRVDGQLRAIFRVAAPDAQKVQLDLLSVYDMVKGEDGVWKVITKPLPPGFHYYYLMIDGFRFSDPSSESFFGVGKKMSRTKILVPDQNFYSPILSNN
jgi:1,4-alpha-glucan branching enzyme